MLTTITFPIIDFRFALSSASKQLEVPNFVRPDYDNQYLRFHGSFLNLQACGAKQAIRFKPGLSQQTVGKTHPFCPQVFSYRLPENIYNPEELKSYGHRVPGRGFASAGKSARWMEVVFCDRAEEKLKGLEGAGTELQQILNDYLALPIETHPALQQKKTSLAKAGPHLARLYLRATTQKSKKAGKRWWAQSSQPIVTVKYLNQGQLFSDEDSYLIKFPEIGVTLAYTLYPYRKHPGRIYWVGISPEHYNDRESRNQQHKLCQYLQQTHLQVESVFAILDQVYALGPSAARENLDIDELLAFLEGLLEKLTNRQQYGFSQALLRQVVINDPRWRHYKARVIASGLPSMIHKYEHLTEVMELKDLFNQGNYAEALHILERIIASNQLEYILDQLIPHSQQEGQSYRTWRNEILQQGGRLRALNQDRQNGTLSESDYRLEMDRIRMGIIGMLEEMGEE